MDALSSVKTYLVGGAVRDRLLKLPVTERDWVVVGATPQMLLSQGYQQVGRDFPVFIHPLTHEEYALARTERKSGKGYTGFICDFGQNVTLEQDLFRRDLTINAIAMDDKEQFIDPYHGIDDLNKRILKHISPAFREDPLRVLRVARFAARYDELGFKIAKETEMLMQQIVTSGEIDYLTAERIWKETEKALSTKNPQVYFQILSNCGALERLFPNLLFNDSISKALQRVSLFTSDLDIRFAVLCAKMEDADSITLLCTKLKIPNRYYKVAVIVQKYWRTMHTMDTLDASQILSLLNDIDVWRNPHRLNQLIMGSKAYYAIDLNEQINYPQAAYLEKAYQIASQVDVKKIIAKGITGKNINIELQKLRKAALSDYILII